MIERILIDVASVASIMFLLFFLYKQIIVLKEIEKAVNIRTLCEIAYIVYSRNSSAKVYSKDEVFFGKNFISIENYTCKIPPVCEEKRVEGLFEIKKKGGCIEVWKR